MMGKLNDAESSYALAGKIAKRQKETARMLRSKIGHAIVVHTRGDLPHADELLEQIAAESERADCMAEAASALHVRSVVAQRRGEFGRAVGIAYEAFTKTSSASERDLILGDIGAYFVAMGRYDAGRDALLVLEATAASEVARVNARVNLVAVAARAGDQEMFRIARARLDGVSIHAEARVNFLIESARGLRAFGESELANSLLEQARDLAIKHEFNRSVFEAEEMLAQPTLTLDTTSGDIRPEYSDTAAEVERELRAMALAVA